LWSSTNPPSMLRWQSVQNGVAMLVSGVRREGRALGRLRPGG
jgi:hypothetical protein